MLKTVGRILLDGLVAIIVLTFLPGIPPYIEFKTLENSTEGKPLEGKLKINSKLNAAKSILDDKITGPESIAVRGNDIFTGVIGGYVVKIDDNHDISNVVKFGQPCVEKWEEKICGRPLGMRFQSDSNLIVADAYYGIFSVNVDTGKAQTLVSPNVEIDGKTPKIFNDVDIAEDGIIYWSDSSSNFHLEDSLFEFLGSPSGRLMRYDPKTNTSTSLISGIQFANGVQLSKKQDVVLVAETGRGRILRYFIKGDRAGDTDIFVDGLPGSPDNIRMTPDGAIFVSLIIPRYGKGLSDYLNPLPYVRKFMSRILFIAHFMASSLEHLLPNHYVSMMRYYIGHLEPFADMLPRHSIIVELDQQGNIVSSLQSVGGKVAHISQITFNSDHTSAYLGSPYNKKLWKLDTKKWKESKQIPVMNIQ